jgi:hypothetical protein
MAKAIYQVLDHIVSLFAFILDPNYAIGRHVANDDRFALTKSELLKERKIINAYQEARAKDLLAHDSFTEKRTCRRMAYLALYF